MPQSDILDAAEKVVWEFRRLQNFEHDDGSRHLEEAILDLDVALGFRAERWEAEHMPDVPTGNLVIVLQKLAKRIDYALSSQPQNRKFVRSAFLAEAARRLNAYRQEERRREHDT